MQEVFGAVIMAGGMSRRMGRDKAALPLNGKTFAEHIRAELSDFEEIYISANDEQRYADLGLQVIRDRYIGCGPMAGLHAALSVCRADALLFVPCDLPFFSREFAEYLLSQSGDVQAVIPRTPDGRHPMSAIYRKDCAPTFESYLKAGRYCVCDPLEQLSVKYVDITQPEYIRALTNINTAEEYEALLRGEKPKLARDKRRK